VIHTYLHLHIGLTGRTKTPSLGTSRKAKVKVNSSHYRPKIA
jgi:hypothetical protein